MEEEIDNGNREEQREREKRRKEGVKLSKK